ncbi:class I SAM-dependent methyltransferase [Sulfitobacter sp. HNIBRBA2951]|uniref:class I SAM-dependent methyltransferase n=1 Tax=Sulfitobacter aquimarinus TaxID=3158557 RepID=UPI0032DF05EC
MDDFFKLHRDLPREGPGEPADVAWAVAQLSLPHRARIVDAGCGSGGDIAALLAAAPQAHVTALDQVPHFVAQVREAWKDDDRVTVLKADMATIANRYELIWCAGAVYFMGVETALRAWRKALLPQGAIAFSQACWFTQDRSEAAQTFWARENPQMTDEAGVNAQIAAAGYKVIGQRRLGDAAWEAYYTPLDARIAMLRAGADAALNAVLDEAEAEAACWRAHRDEFGYLLSVVAPQ